MKENEHTPRDPRDPVGVERLLLAERDAVLRRDWRAATEDARERTVLKEFFYRPKIKRPA